MGTDYGDITRFRVRILVRNVLLDDEMQDLFLAVSSGTGIAANMLARKTVLPDVERKVGHSATETQKR